ncbi:4Fe-4S binding protein [Methanopyrus sp. KOL6]|uniref:NADH-quinone oxidoreductase subunit B family protein n=1 Tax=Methanopyrus sp. KOL6 TaxID=1937004 RepID=UPI000B4AC377|nr:4Fe-4S dicluster domain-containing protein [Methanopyrus sp. KOL6]
MKVAVLSLMACGACARNLEECCYEDGHEIVWSSLDGDEGEPDADVLFVEGSVDFADAETLEKLEEAASAASTVVSLGSCAATGGFERHVIGMRDPDRYHFTVFPAAKFIDTDYAINGCPPTTDVIASFLRALEEENEDELRPYEVLSGDFHELTPELSSQVTGPTIPVEDVLLTSNKDLCLGCDLDVIERDLFCVGCGTCAASCPAWAIEMDEKPVIQQERCIRCGTCFVSCPRSFKIPNGR